MREIKFRGFNTKNNQWLYGSHILNRGKHFVAPDEFADGKTWKDYEVEPKTIGEFTGLFDEDGREIYEGDIIKIVEEFDDENVYTRNGVVCFVEGIYELQDKNGKHFAYLGWMQNDDAITKLEVVGNIYDNPGLMEKGGGHE